MLNTVRNKLSSKLPKYSIATTKEPGGTEVGQDIRQILLKNTYKTELTEKTKALLFYADRAQHYKEFLKPALNEPNTIVLSDRFFETTLVYQYLMPKIANQSKEISLEGIKALHDIVVDGLHPDQLFIIDSNKPHGVTEGDKHDEKGSEFRFNIRSAYNYLIDNKDQLGLDYPITKIDTSRAQWNEYVNLITERILSNL